MSPKQWRTSREPRAMYQWLTRPDDYTGFPTHRTSGRKLLLFALACGRNFDSLPSSFDLGDAERQIDDLDPVEASRLDWGRGEAAATASGYGGARGAGFLRDIVGDPFRPPLPFAVGDAVVAVPPFVLASGSGRYAAAVVVSLDPFALASEGGDMLWTATPTPADVAATTRPVDPGDALARWRRDGGMYRRNRLYRFVQERWRTPEVRSLAHGVYDSPLGGCVLDPVRLAVLSDALEEQGCNDTRLLRHLRSRVEHVKGCWALDLLLKRP